MKRWTMYKALLMAFCLSLATPLAGHAQVIFNDSFDASPDWQSAENYSPANSAAWPATWIDNPYGAPQPPPMGWTSYRSAIPARGGHEKTFVLSGEGARNQGGKGMTYNIETSSYGTWAGGGLDVYLGNTGYQEIFVRAYIKYDPDTFHWGTVVPNFAIQKLGRVSRYKKVPSRTENPQVFFSTTSDQTPTFYPDIFNNPAYNSPPTTNPVHFRGLHVLDPGAGDAISDDVWALPCPADGKWHSYEFRVKMNSAPGVADGEWEVWLDGGNDASRHYLKKGLPWVSSPSSIYPGWNWITLMDNSTVQPDIAYANTVLKMFMDDVVISTHYSGPPPAPANVTAQPATATSARVSWSAGTSSAKYLLDGYRVYYGMDPANLVNYVSAGAATQAEIPNLQAGQTYYFAVTGYNKPDTNQGENESLMSEKASIIMGAQSQTTDAIAPTVSIASPANGATVSGSTSVTVAATDNVGVSKVELYVNGALYGLAGSAPYTLSWNTASYGDGSYQLTAKGYDIAGNSKLSSSVTVSVQNAVAASSSTSTTPVATAAVPAIQVVSPAENAAVPAVTTISASATSSLGILQMRIYVDNVLKSYVDNASSVSWNWDTTLYSKGSHVIMLYAFDKAKTLSIYKYNVTTGASDAIAPTVTSFSMPANSTTATVPVILSATDNTGVTGYYISESSVAPLATAAGWYPAIPTSFTFGGEGNRTAYAWGKDAAGNVSAAKGATVNITFPDVSAPVASITSPAGGSTLNGPVNVTVSASDNKGVSKVEFFLNGVLRGTATSAPYALSLNTATYANGSYTLSAKAYDAAGNVGQSQTVSVTFSNDTTAPVVGNFSMPSTSKNRTVAVSSFSATDNVGVTGYMISENATAPLASSGSWSATAPTSFTFTGEGVRTAYAWAKDVKGNISQSRSASVTITLPDTTPPTISIISPAVGLKVPTSVTISASATDKSGIIQMRVYVDKALKAVTNAGSISYVWDTKSVVVGAHNIEVWAFDSVRNYGIAKVAVQK